MILPIQSMAILETTLFGLGIAFGYEIIGKYMTPDWDIVGMTKDEGRMMNELPILGHFLVGISTTYGSIFRRHHRSTITHFPLLSTSIRYLFVFWWLVWEMLRIHSHFGWYLFWGMLLGTSIADSIHWYLDKIRYPKSE